jgi:hypothetical protein
MLGGINLTLGKYNDGKKLLESALNTLRVYGDEHFVAYFSSRLGVALKNTY